MITYNKSLHLIKILVSIVVTVLLKSAVVTFGQVPKPSLELAKGLMEAQYFTEDQYGGNSYNWVALQHPDQRMLFGNTDGLMVFDGGKWEIYPTGNGTAVKSIAIANNGDIYVGAHGELGVFRKEGDGLLYTSLRSVLPDSLQGGEVVRRTFVLGGKVYFDITNRLYVYSPGQKAVAYSYPQDKAGKTFKLAGKCYVWVGRKGLYAFSQGNMEQLLNLPQWEVGEVVSLLPMNNNTFLLTTAKEGLFTINVDTQSIAPFESPANDLLKLHLGAASDILPDSSYVLCTRSGGVIFMNKNGTIRSHLDESLGLPSNAIISSGFDRQGGVWFTSTDGLIRYQYDSPISTWNRLLGLPKNIYNIQSVAGSFYAATGEGLFEIDLSTTPNHFVKLPGINQECYDILKVEESVFVVSREGFHVNSGKGFRKVEGIEDAFALLFRQDNKEGGTLLAGTSKGIDCLFYENGQWIPGGKIPYLNDWVNYMAQDKNGTLWVATATKAVYAINIKQGQSPTDTAAIQIRQFGESDGLFNDYYFIYHFDDRVFLHSISQNDSIYVFDPVKDHFQPAKSELAQLFGVNPKWQLPLFSNQDQKGDLYFLAKPDPEQDIYYFHTANKISIGEYKVTRYPTPVPLKDFYGFRKLGNAVWYFGLKNMVRQELESSQWSKAQEEGFPAFINEVVVNDDSVLFNGFPKQSFTLPYRYNTLKFSFAAASFEKIALTKYRYLLKGYDSKWSKLITERKKEYTNLPEGDYTFQVKALNTYGKESTLASFSFQVLPPWYRSIYAWLAYIVLGVVSVWGIVKLRSVQLERDKARLTLVVNERTQELKVKNHRLAENAKALKELDQLKSNFFANISHEFRTPLTLILSPVEDMLHSIKEVKVLEKIRGISRNAQRLRHLIDQLLDLSKLEAGKMSPTYHHGDFVRFLRLVSGAFQSLAESKGITLEIRIVPHELKMDFDYKMVETILYNLLSNAIKFTPQGGVILCELTVDEANPSYVNVAIKDTGVGIPKEKLEKVFDRFYQVEGDAARRWEGTGIGLSLSMEFTQLIGGQLKVESEIGKGSTFMLTLPLNQEKADHDAGEPLHWRTGMVSPNIIEGAGEDLDNPAEVEEDPSMSTSPLYLLIEDNKELIHYLDQQLPGRHLLAYDGEQGVKLALEYVPDIILCDIMMPKLDGMGVCKQLRQHPATSHIPFILLTAKSGTDIRIEGLELGADDFVSKPFHLAELKVRIYNLLEQRRKLQSKFKKEKIIEPKEVSVTSVDERFLEKVVEVIENNMSENHLNAEFLASELGMVQRTLYKKIKALTNQSLSEFIRLYRLQHAALLLRKGAGNVTEVMYDVGIQSQSYFSKSFKEVYGIPPQQYAREYKA